MSVMKWVIVGIAAILGLTSVGTAQLTETEQFSVISIRPGSCANTMMRENYEPILPVGRYVDVCTTVRTLIEQAFSIPADLLLEGLPNWTNDKYFSINAKADSGYAASSRLENKEHVLAMVRAMLVDRFHLAMRVEKRPRKGFSLRIGKTGVKFNIRPLSEEAAFALDVYTQPNGGGGVRGTSATMSDLAEQLTDSLQEPVQDDTGISGCLDFSVKWQGEGNGTPGDFGNPDFNIGVMSAIQRELGLRFVAKTLRVSYWVVTRIEEPSEN
jgi:uncharacterized protein (TIGR03435 family)